MKRKPYPSDVRYDEWAFITSYLSLLRKDAPHREYPLQRGVQRTALRRAGGISWRMIPNDLPPWEVVY